jgi:hypothetical protein
VRRKYKNDTIGGQQKNLNFSQKPLSVFSAPQETQRARRLGGVDMFLSEDAFDLEDDRTNGPAMG